VLQTYVRLTLAIAQATDGLRRRIPMRRDRDAGLATLEWVALAIVAVTLAAVAGAGIRAAIERKINQIP
jgi:hypothetical protein